MSGFKAYDTALASRVRHLLGENPEITEREMFGGIAFLLSGNMAVGVARDELMVRIDPDDYDEAMAMTGVRAFDMPGRPMRGWILVAPEITAESTIWANGSRSGSTSPGPSPPNKAP